MQGECAAPPPDAFFQQTSNHMQGECAAPPPDAFFQQTSNQSFAAPGSTSSVRPGQCVVLTEAPPFSRAAQSPAPLWLHGLYLLMDATGVNSGLGTPAEALYVTDSTVQSTVEAFAIEAAFFQGAQTTRTVVRPERLAPRPPPHVL